MTDAYQKLLKDTMTLRGIKYHVPSRGILGKDQIWRLYVNIRDGHSQTEYFEHIEFYKVKAFTGENLYRIGYALFATGAVTFDYNENDNMRRYAIVHDGSYIPKYIKQGDEIVPNPN